MQRKGMKHRAGFASFGGSEFVDCKFGTTKRRQLLSSPALTVLCAYRGEAIENWQRGVRWLLSMQNQDGGWSAFDKDCSKRWLEWIPANNMKRSMSDPSTPDMTGRVVEFLVGKQVAFSLRDGAFLAGDAAAHSRVPT